MNAISMVCAVLNRAIRDPCGLQDERAETADRRNQITKDVSVMRLDHLPTEGVVQCGKAFL